ncbi:NUMOD4 domain-containing protein [Rossellomorea aquimaris]|uniref:NUMOD4 domain-containing protein n=1 Tax=Rossellomorea aquimaris TaxID=189382 RepID=UPI0011E91CCC|nr:NUMOD4 domain-containing protein [Rossellomorea aquimaris]TYS91926.1 endonuclease [Rossellomorea aquimaris]
MRNLVWKPVGGYEGFYEVSSSGDIRGVERVTTHGRRIKSKLRKLYIGNHGYKFTMLNKDGKQKSLTVHRLVANAFIPNPENKGDVNHIDGNKMNNSVDNLEWLTRSENIRHAHKLGLNTFVGAKGEKHHNSKLTESRVKEIKILISRGKSNKEISEIFNIKTYIISNIRNGRNWKHVKAN